MRVFDRYLRWVFGEKRYREGYRLSDLIFLPIFTPLAFLQDLFEKERFRKASRA